MAQRAQREAAELGARTAWHGRSRERGVIRAQPMSAGMQAERKARGLSLVHRTLGLLSSFQIIKITTVNDAHLCKLGASCPRSGRLHQVVPE